MNEMQNSPGRVVAAIILIGLGALFLIKPDFGFNIFWPFFIIVPGLVFLFFAATGDKGTSALAIPGTIITGTGLILFYQSVTNDWSSWTYVWTLYPVFVGMGLLYMGRRTGDKGNAQVGRGLIFGGLVGFALFWALFGGLSGVVVPLALIGAGLWLLVRGGVIKLDAGGSVGSKAKRAFDDAPIFSGAPVVGKSQSRPSSSDELRKKIDEALADDDAPEEGAPEEGVPEEGVPEEEAPGEDDPED